MFNKMKTLIQIPKMYHLMNNSHHNKKCLEKQFIIKKKNQL